MAIAHEWVSARAGSEKVFEELARMYPSADLYAMSMTPGVLFDAGARRVTTTFIDRLGPLRDRRQVTLPLMPLAWRMTGCRQTYDVVLTSSHACVKGFRPARRAHQFWYVHAPMRYVWSPDIDARGAAAALAAPRAVMRRWDLRSVRWVNSFAANSTAVADRVKQFYGRDAQVIPPPVDTSFFAAAATRERSGLVSVGRLIPCKGHDLALRVAERLGEPITIVGRGPEEARLRQLAARLGVSASFQVDATDEQLRDHVASARVLLFPAVEDFGIVPVEAQAAGAPVVGPAEGGLIDTVLPGRTGELSATLDLDDLVQAAGRAMTTDYDRSELQTQAQRFSIAEFRKRIGAWTGLSWVE